MPKLLLKKEEPIKQEVKVVLTLVSSADGSVDLRGEDEDGTKWFLLNINKDGEVGFYGTLPDHLGFTLSQGTDKLTVNEDFGD
jgi:hypothetical protein